MRLGENPMPSDKTTTAAQRYDEGNAAFSEGKSLSANPYFGLLAWEWTQGWLNAEKAQEARTNGAKQK